jgi:hypothetical protein
VGHLAGKTHRSNRVHDFIDVLVGPRGFLCQIRKGPDLHDDALLLKGLA